MIIASNRLSARIDEAKLLINSVLTENNTVIASTKFSSDSLVFLHLVSSVAPDIPIIWVDTGYNNRHTQAFVVQAIEKLRLNVMVFEPENHKIQIPPSIDDPAHAAFKETVKLAPFKHALNVLNATHWLSSVRSYQTPNREVLAKTVKLPNCVTKVHPMLDWTEEDVNDYRKQFNLPKGPEAYDPTKGDAMSECGLHEVKNFF